jgi:hypothetical protein
MRKLFLALATGLNMATCADADSAYLTMITIEQVVQFPQRTKEVRAAVG